jgi:phospholipase/carboxylesterase
LSEVKFTGQAMTIHKNNAPAYNVIKPLIIETHAQVDASIIWLHGLGANQYDFVPLVEQLQLPSHLRIRFIFPQAPEKAITINQGYVMPAWYDITEQVITAKQDQAGIEASSNYLTQLCLQQEEQGIKAEKIVMAGFSQGGAIALHSGCRYPKQLAGIMALSSYLPLANKLDKEISGNIIQTPVFMAHGEYDDVIPLDVAKTTAQQLKKHKIKLQWQQYPMAHTVSEAEISDISQWLGDII